MFYSKGLEYYLPLAVSAALIFVFLYFSLKKLKNADENKKLLPVRIAFFALVALEIIKIFLLIGEDGHLSAVRYPVVFCSVAMYAYPLFCFKKTRLAALGKSFAIIPCLIAGMMFFIRPGDLFTDTPVYVFITCHSFFYHGVLLAIALYLILSKLYTFEFADHFTVAAGLAGYLLFCAAASIAIGTDISIFGPDSGFLGWLFDKTGYATGMLAAAMFFYLVCFAVYKPIDVHRKRRLKNTAGVSI